MLLFEGASATSCIIDNGFMTDMYMHILSSFIWTLMCLLFD